MANDKGDGEDLFEDLDKFFAPIRDVDWDEALAGATLSDCVPVAPHGTETW